MPGLHAHTGQPHSGLDHLRQSMGIGSSHAAPKASTCAKSCLPAGVPKLLALLHRAMARRATIAAL